MRTASTALATHLAQESVALATCWKITRRDGSVFAFTDHDQDITVGGVTYQAAVGYQASAVETSSRLNVDNLDAVALIDSDVLSSEDLEGGSFDYATIEIFLVNWSDTSQSTVTLMKGLLGEVSVQGERYEAEMRSLAQKLQQTYGRIIGPECDAPQLGHARCGVAVAAYTVSGSVTATGSEAEVFADSARSEDTSYFAHGIITWVTGDNAGFSTWVRATRAASPGLWVRLGDPPPYAIGVGDTYSMVAGCDRRATTCKNKFANFANFQGFPGVPGIDDAIEWGGR